MSWYMVDVETDGPIPGKYSMVAIGIVRVDASLDETFFAQLAPISENWEKESLEKCNYTREQTLSFNDPQTVMQQFYDWVNNTNKTHRPQFIADNGGFDWMFCCWYFEKFIENNPFGHSARDLGSLYKGFAGSTFKNFKHMRDTKHTHNPLDDAMGNAEALLKMKEMGLEIKW